MQPQLEHGESGGRDIFVVTDWMAKQMYDLGYLQEFDKSTIPNVEENSARRVRGARLRPRAQLLDAVAERHDRASGQQATRRRDITSVNDLFDPKYKGKVDGARPSCATPCRW